MKRTLIAGVTALSVMLSGFSATPVAANTDDEAVGRLLFGLATLLVIGKAIENANDRDDRRDTADHRPSRRDHADRPAQRRLPMVPSQCLRRFETNNGERPLFVRRCLERNMPQMHRLPASCAIRINTDRGRRNGYAPRCLRQNGFRWSR